MLLHGDVWPVFRCMGNCKLLAMSFDSIDERDSRYKISEYLCRKTVISSSLTLSLRNFHAYYDVINFSAQPWHILLYNKVPFICSIFIKPRQIIYQTDPEILLYTTMLKTSRINYLLVLQSCSEKPIKINLSKNELHFITLATHNRQKELQIPSKRYFMIISIVLTCYK